MKVAEDWEEPFKKENTTYYVWNTVDNRRRMDNSRKSKGIVRSDSNPRFFRIAFKNTYVRDNSKFSRQGSNFRDDSRLGSNYRQNSNARSGSNNKQNKSQERPKSEMFRKVENLEKEFEKFTKSQNEMKEILKNKLINTQFVEEDIVVDIKDVNDGTDIIM